MFKLEHEEAIVLLQIIEANTFQGNAVQMLGKLIGKLQREMKKTAPRQDVDVTEEWQSATTDG